MPTKSKARQAVERLLEAATDPTEKAELASRLSRIIAEESRSQARRQRVRRNREKAKKDEPKPFDGDEMVEFRLCDCPLDQPCTCPPPAPPPAPKPAAVVSTPPPPIEPVAVEVEQPVNNGNGYGETRVISAWNLPGAEYWDPFDRCVREDFMPMAPAGEIAFNPWLAGATGATSVETYSNEKGWHSQWERDQKQREESEWQERMDKMYGR